MKILVISTDLEKKLWNHTISLLKFVLTKQVYLFQDIHAYLIASALFLCILRNQDLALQVWMQMDWFLNLKNTRDRRVMKNVISEAPRDSSRTEECNPHEYSKGNKRRLTKKNGQPRPGYMSPGYQQYKDTLLQQNYH